MLEKNTYTFQHRPWVIPVAVAATIALGIAGIVMINNRPDETAEVTPAASTLPAAEPVVEVSSMLMARAEQFDALMVEQGLTGLVLDNPVDVTDVYDFGYAPDADEPRDYRAVEWTFEVGPVEARLALHESLSDPSVMGERLTVDSGRGTADGDAWIDAVVQTMVRLHEPGLPESQIVDLAADLIAPEGMYFEDVWSSNFVSGLPDGTTLVVDANSVPYFVESDRAEPLALDQAPDQSELAVAQELDRLLTGENVAGLILESGAVYEGGNVGTLHSRWPIDLDTVDGWVELYTLSPGAQVIDLIIEDGANTPDVDTWLSHAVRAVIMIQEPDLTDDDVDALANRLTFADTDLLSDGAPPLLDHEEEVGRSFFLAKRDTATSDSYGYYVLETAPVT